MTVIHVTPTEIVVSWQSAGELLPAETHATLQEAALGPGRLIIIGDVHGCVKELRELLDEADYVEGEDTVVLVGDLVDKGPYPLEVPRPCTPPAQHCLPLICVSDVGQRSLGFAAQSTLSASASCRTCLPEHAKVDVCMLTGGVYA